MCNTSLEILELLRDTKEPNLSSQEIAETLGLGEQQTINTMKTLTELGLVSRVRENTGGTKRHKHNVCSHRFLYTITEVGKGFLNRD